MLNLSRNGRSIYILYGSSNYITGHTVVAEIYDEANVKNSSNVTLSEIGTTGLYGGSFTPDAVGEWKVKIKDNVLYKAHASITITEHDEVSIGGDVVSIKNILESTTYGNEALKTKLDGIEGSGFATGSDSLKAVKDYLVNTIQSSITQIQNNTRTTVAIPQQMLRPVSGNSIFKVYLNVYDASGNMEDPDDQDSGSDIAMVSVSVVDESGNSRDSNVGGLSASTQDSLNWMTRDAEGRFSCTYTVAYTHDLEQLLFTFNYLEGGLARTIDRASIVTSVLDITDSVNNIYSEVTNVTYGLSALKTLIDSYLANGGTIESRIDGVESNLTSIESKIDAMDTVADNTYAIVSHSTYGQAALKVLIDALQLDMTSVKGSGFVTGTDSLKAISDRQQAIQGTSWSSTTDTLHEIRAAIDGLEMGSGGYIA